jgi:hypothetical protein
MLLLSGLVVAAALGRTPQLLDTKLAALDAQFRHHVSSNNQHAHVDAKFHSVRAAEHKNARHDVLQHKAEVGALARSLVTAKDGSVRTMQVPGVPSLPPLPTHDASAADYELLYEAAQDRLAALNQHCADCSASDVLYEVTLDYSVVNHTIAQEAAETLVYAQSNHSAAQSNYSDQINEYVRIKGLLTGTDITWDKTPTLHQVVVDNAVALKAQALVVQDARDTYYTKGNASADAQANYTNAASNATEADRASSDAKNARDTACAALTIAPSPPPTPPPPTPPPPTSPPPDAFEVRTSGRCVNIATVEQCQGYAVHHSANGGMLTTPPQQTFPLGCFMIRDWFGNGDQVFYKAETDPNTNRECNPTGRICLCAPP